MSLPNRRPNITEDVDGYAITVSYDPEAYMRGAVRGRPELKPIEIFVSKRDRAGSWLEGHQYELGVTASKLMQGEWLDED